MSTCRRPARSGPTGADVSVEHGYAYAPMTVLREAMHSGDLSPAALLDTYLDRAERLNGQAKAYIEILADRSRASVSSGLDTGPLSGMAIAVKDLIDVKGIPTTAGSRVLHDNIADEDAFVVERLESAGAVIIGKANLHEFAYGATGENATFGTAPNPYNPDNLACGSSSGSAAAVSFGLASAALGTDTGGSVRAPSVMCGLVGLKPTMGRVSRHGVIPFCWSLDHVGITARNAADAARLLTAVAGFDVRDTASQDVPVDDYESALDGGLAGLRIGVPRDFFFDHVDPVILGAIKGVIAEVGKAGAEIVDVDMPDMEHTRTVALTVQMPEALSYHNRYLEDRLDLYGEDFRAGLALGQSLLAEHYVRAKRFMELYRQGTNAVFENVDLLLTPAAPVTAPPLGASHVDVGGRREPAGNAITRFLTFFNMTGHPALALPAGLHPNGLPYGVQVVGRYFDESRVLRAAYAIERLSGVSAPLPPAV